MYKKRVKAVHFLSVLAVLFAINDPLLAQGYDPEYLVKTRYKVAKPSFPDGSPLPREVGLIHKISDDGAIAGSLPAVNGPEEGFFFLKGYNFTVFEGPQYAGTDIGGIYRNKAVGTARYLNPDGSFCPFVFDFNKRTLTCQSGVAPTTLYTDINSVGTIVEYSPWGGTRLIYANGTIEQLDNVPGYPTALNRYNQISGIKDVYVNNNYKTNGFLWQNGNTTIVGDFGGQYSQANDINNKGTVVGGGYDTSGQHIAYIYKNGVTTVLGSLPEEPGFFSSWTDAHAINDNEEVVGDSYGRAFYYKGGKMWQLDGLLLRSSKLSLRNSEGYMGFLVDAWDITPKGLIEARFQEVDVYGLRSVILHPVRLGDLDGDGRFSGDLEDKDKFLECQAAGAYTPGASVCEFADFNADGVVNSVDCNFFRSNYGLKRVLSCPS